MAALLLCGQMCWADVFDVAADFSATSNPNGPWCYGWSSTMASELHIYTQLEDCPDPYAGYIACYDPLNFFIGTPSVHYNSNSYAIDFGYALVLPGQLIMHPGAGDEYSRARWTAPFAGIADVAASFTGCDYSGPTSTDVHVLLNGAPLFDGAVNGFGPGSASPYAATIPVAAGDTLDFAVGFGTGGFNCDSTGVAAMIDLTPEPATLALLALGGLGALRRRTRK